MLDNLDVGVGDKIEHTTSMIKQKKVLAGPDVVVVAVIELHAGLDFSAYGSCRPALCFLVGRFRFESSGLKI